ncbi:MAG: hypothetical protein ACP5OS_09445 [Leptospirillia bacterium]
MKSVKRMGQRRFSGGALLVSGLILGIVLGLAPPLWAATSSAPCNGSGALGATMGGCAKPPASPPSGRGSGISGVRPAFSEPMMFKVATTKASPEEEIRRNVASWVAKRILPRPTSNESALLASVVRSLVLTRFPVGVEKIGVALYSVSVDATTLNHIASDLSRALSSGRLTYRVSRIAVTGGSEKENRFVEKNLPIFPKGVVDAQEISDTLYAVAQIPGFTRVDGIFAPTVGVTDVRFDRPITFTIKGDQAHSFWKIRHMIALYVGKRVLDMSTPEAQAIVRKVAETAGGKWWQPMEIVFARDKRGRIYQVTVSPETLETLKGALIEMAHEGAIPKDSTSSPELSTSGILSMAPSETDLSAEPSQPSTGQIFSPNFQAPALENLFVHVQPTPTFSGSQLDVNNYGYAPTGALMLNATGNANNVGAAGGLFTVMASTSFGGMNSGTLSYSLPFDLANRVGIDLNAMNYTLGLGFSPWGHGANAGQLAALGVSGSNYSGDLWAAQTFLQKPDGRFVIKETGFLKEFQDTYSQTSQNDRSLLGGILDLSGFKTLGQFTGSLDLSDTEYFLQQGSGSDPANPFYNDTQGLQNYMTGNGSLRYTLTPVWSVTLGGILQQYFGGGTLDPMLQATLGGVSNVMALPTASLFGNNLYAGTLTLTRTDGAKAGVFDSSLFFDAGQVTGLGTNYSAMGPGVEESVSSTHWFARADLAVPIGGLPTEALGQSLTALTGGNIGQGGIPLQMWLSLGARY